MTIRYITSLCRQFWRRNYVIRATKKRRLCVITFNINRLGRTDAIKMTNKKMCDIDDLMTVVKMT